MSLKHDNHKDAEHIDAEFRNIESTKQAKITIADRAPIVSDQGEFWYDWSGNKFYGRHKNTKAWQAV